MKNTVDKTCKRKIFASVIVPVSLLAILVNACLLPLKRVHDRNVLELKELNEKISPAKEVAGRAPLLLQQELDLSRKLNAVFPFILSPDTAYTDLNLKTYDFARKIGLDLRSVNHHPSPAESWMNSARACYFCRPFSLNMTAQGRLEQIYQFVGLIEKDNPFAAVSEMALRLRDPSMAVFYMELVVDWPVFSERSIHESLQKMYDKKTGSAGQNSHK